MLTDSTVTTAARIPSRVKVSAVTGGSSKVENRAAGTTAPAGRRGGAAAWRPAARYKMQRKCVPATRVETSCCSPSPARLAGTQLWPRSGLRALCVFTLRILDKGTPVVLQQSWVKLRCFPSSFSSSSCRSSSCPPPCPPDAHSFKWTVALTDTLCLVPSGLTELESDMVLHWFVKLPSSIPHSCQKLCLVGAVKLWR